MPIPDPRLGPTIQPRPAESRRDDRRADRSADGPAEAWVSFIRPVTPDSMASLLGAVQTLAEEAVEHVHLGIGSGGGNIIAGLSAYSQLRALPLRYTTYNLGSVDSVAILPYLLGGVRFVEEWASFLFHGVSWTFAGSGETAAAQVADAFGCIASNERTLSRLTAERTGLAEEVVRAMRAGSTIVDAAEAVRLNLATCRGSFAVPRRGRWWQV